MHFIVKMYKLSVLQYFVHTCFTQNKSIYLSFAAYNSILIKTHTNEFLLRKNI